MNMGTTISFISGYAEVTFEVDGEERTFVAELTPASPQLKEFAEDITDEDFKEYVCDGLARAFLAEGSHFLARIEIRGGAEG